MPKFPSCIGDFLIFSLWSGTSIGIEPERPETADAPLIPDTAESYVRPALSICISLYDAFAPWSCTLLMLFCFMKVIFFCGPTELVCDECAAAEMKEPLDVS